MSGQKTEEPTPKKIKDARKDGQVAKSSDLTASAVLLTATAVLSLGGGFFIEKLQELMKQFFDADLIGANLDSTQILQLLGEAGGRILLLTLPFSASIAIVGGLVVFLQVQPLFAPKAVKPKFERLNPVKGFKNKFFKANTYLELLKNLLKFLIATALVILVVSGSLRDLVLTARQPLLNTVGLTSGLMFELLWKVSIVFVFIGIADFFLQKKLHLKELKMSKYEIKKEHKESEGDPQIKHQRKEVHQEVLAQNMTADVPKADVIVINPTHLAVAIQYDQSSMHAPQVTAKGRNLMAEKIKEIAQKHRVPVMRNIPLARGLFEVELGSEIPAELYEAVAEVLNWVYEISQQER